jgi:hypothetical protein
MSTGSMRIAALAVPVLLAAACAGEEAGTDELGTDTMVVDTGMYAPPPPPVTDTGMMGMDTMGAVPDTTGMQ